MRFKGQLLIPAEPGPGLNVDIELADHRLAVVSNDGELGTWPLDAVQVRRLQGDTFAMTVAGEDLHFVADDTISFAYDGIQAIEKVRGRTRVRSPFQGLRDIFGFGGDTPADSGAELPIPQITTTGAATASESDSLGVTTDRGPADTDLSSAVDHTPTVQGRYESADRPPRSHDIEIEDWLIEPRKLDNADKPLSGLEQGQPFPDGIGSPDLTEELRCKAFRNDGLPCQSSIVGDSGYCFPHDPENPVNLMVRDAHEARTRLKQKRAHRLTRVYGRLDRALKQLERGEIDTDQAMAMAQLARTMCAILELNEGEDSEGDEDAALF